MSAPMPRFAVIRPAGLEEALQALRRSPAPRPLAGGTDLITNLRHGLVAAETLLDLSRIETLRGITRTGTGWRIGAGVRLCEIVECADLAGFAALLQAARSVAGPAHREAATLGGNLCQDTRCLHYNQSDWWRRANGYCLKYRGETCHVAPRGNRCRAAYCGDLAPALMVLGAEAEIVSGAGSRRIPLTEMFREDGAAWLRLGPGELLAAIHLPAPPPRDSAYEKIRLRGAMEFPLAGVAVALSGSGTQRRIRLALTGTNSCPLTVELPPLPAPGADAAPWLAALEKRVQSAASPQRTTTVAPHYRRLSAAALAARLAGRMI